MAQEPMVADISQTAGQKGGRIGQAIQTLQRSSLYLSFVHDRVMCGGETWQVMGIPLYLTELGLVQCEPLSLAGASSLTHTQMRTLAGNSVHAMVAGMFTAWA